MTEGNFAKLFFPGTRTENLVQGITLLQSSEGEKRIKLDLLMSFPGGKVGSMPSYLGDPYEQLLKADTIARSTKLDLELESMSLFVYTTEDHDKTAQVLYNVLLNSFTMARDKQGEDEDELSEVCLKFVARVPSNPKLWAWLYAYHRGHLFVRFESTQAELDLKPTVADEQQLPLGEHYEEERREATSKARDEGRELGHELPSVSREKDATWRIVRI